MLENGSKNLKTNNMANPIFYSSNTDKHFIPEEAGWYIQYYTESGDSDAIKVDREPKDNADALAMLEQIDPHELWEVKFFAEVHNLNGSIAEAVKALLNEMTAKVDPDFNFDYEHWDNGNYDDSYEYGIEVGEEYTYREIVGKLEEIIKINDDRDEFAIKFANWLRKEDIPENAEKYFHYSDKDMLNTFKKENK